MEAGDLVWLVAFVAWLLSGLLGRFARRRLAPPQSSPEQREPRSPEDHDRAAAHRRMLEELGLPEEEILPWEEEDDLGWSPPPAPAPAPAPAPRALAVAAPPPLAKPPSFRPQQPPPLRAMQLGAKATALEERPARTRDTLRHSELARAIVLADILDRPLALRTPRTL